MILICFDLAIFNFKHCLWLLVLSDAETTKQVTA